MSTPKKNGQTEKKTLHCLVDAKAYDYLRRYVLDSGTSISAFINEYLNMVYAKRKRHGNERKNTDMD